MAAAAEERCAPKRMFWSARMEWEEDVTKHKMRSLPFQKCRKEVKKLVKWKNFFRVLANLIRAAS